MKKKKVYSKDFKLQVVNVNGKIKMQEKLQKKMYINVHKNGILLLVIGLGKGCEGYGCAFGNSGKESKRLTITLYPLAYQTQRLGNMPTQGRATGELQLAQSLRKPLPMNISRNQDCHQSAYNIHQSINSIEPPYAERYVRWCKRTATQLMSSLLLDFHYLLF